jgi:hypothetical protein
MITSNRNFGIEIEFFCDTKKQQRQLYDMISLVDDGSIRHVPNSAEYVSPILNGQAGEAELRRVCELIKKNGGRADNPAMSVHLHLDGRRKESEVQYSVEKPSKFRTLYRVSDKLLRTLTPSQIEHIVYFGEIPRGTVQVSEFSRVTTLSLARITTEPVSNFTYIYTVRPERFNWLQNMMYFYTQYSQVMEDIVSKSRRFGNMYCIPLGKSYNLEDIESVSDESELMNLWYKGRGGPSGHYDDSRYHNVNFHSYWDSHGTVEIRSHGGTVDPVKILLWTKLHQKIADKLEGMTLEQVKATNSNLHLSFLEFVEEPLLQNYVKRLLGYYSSIKIK